MLDFAQFHPFIGMVVAIAAGAYTVVCALIAVRFTSGQRRQASFTPADFGLAYESVGLHPRGDRRRHCLRARA